MKFTIYSKEDCPYCEKIKKILTLTNQSFVVYTLNTHFDKNQFYSEFGEGSTFPQVICDDKKLGGCTNAVKFLKEKNILV
jgi:glutaredoxin